MVVRLLHVWEQRLAAVIDRLPTVTLGLRRFARGCHDPVSAFLAGRPRCRPGCPAEVWSQMSVWFCHGSDIVLAVTFMQPAILMRHVRVVRAMIKRGRFPKGMIKLIRFGWTQRAAEQERHRHGHDQVPMMSQGSP